MNNIRVTLVNPDEIENLYTRWGSYARICYNSPEGRELFIGKGCHNTRHYSGSRTTYFIFHVENVSRCCTAQMNRTSIGCVINEKSMRYVDFSNAQFTIPPSIANNPEAMRVYNDITDYTKNGYKQLQDLLKLDGLYGENNNQDARYALSIGIQTEGMWGYTLESLEHLCHERLCERAQWEIREVVKQMKKEVLKVMPELKDKLVSQCIADGYCWQNKMQCDKFKDVILTKNEFDKLRKSDDWKSIVKNIKQTNNIRGV